MVQDVAVLTAGMVEFTSMEPWKNTGLNMICSDAPGRLAYQPKELFPVVQDAVPDQQIVAFVPLTVPFDALRVSVCAVRFAKPSANGEARPVVDAATGKYWVPDMAFQADRFQSQTPYRACVPLWKLSAAALVICVRCPVPNSISRNCPAPGTRLEMTSG